MNDLMIHINKTLDFCQFNELAEDIRSMKGVFSICRDENEPRFISVGYSPIGATSIDILNIVADYGVKASLVGRLQIVK